MSDVNDRVKIVSDTTLSQGWTRLSDYQLDYTDRNGETQRIKREVFHRTPAACILLHDRERDIVVLVKQFRLPAHLIGEPSFMIEVPAGLLDGEDAEDAIRREAMEETGYRIRDVRFVFKALTSPGSVTEVIHFFHASIDLSDRINEGGGLADEHEDLEVLEFPLDKAVTMIADGEIIDAKTIMLLQWAVLNRAAL
ncbi:MULTISPECIES: NUDIX domain-containing protein [Rhizobium]|jgi:ADP-ribose pyrophosphatase|uniref:GDP-mannose pyrophosphatase n=1 Tax=Rhizobium soli TaxID=424798 RepID=A0A7X0JM90_9HYPH|nr:MULTISPECIES: NUDIX domain-containing protein [Rhizobium]MBB6509246.1 ADP-ribose pyrophosphatase [Rhizobium soli]MBD8663603.1 NUDIX domain-containing protein [Rhizobium sp. CFBP 8752]MBP2460678.1 ADP-ribose pyrophosphatase [Rhizobium sp. PvP014]MBP2528075.1 ADP-ribose pyrophosphatase [Rhizobium sp. PvP099]